MSEAELRKVKCVGLINQVCNYIAMSCLAQVFDLRKRRSTGNDGKFC